MQSGSRSRVVSVGAVDCDGLDAVASQLGIDDVWAAQYYECRLVSGDDRVDYLLSLSRSAAGAALSRVSGAVSAFAAERRPEWSPVVSLLESWASGVSLLSARSPTVWLEFDDPRASSAAPPVPSVSVCLVPDYREDRPPPAADASDELSLVHEVLATLGPAGATTPQDALLAECFTRLPPGARWIHLSVMLGRPGRDVKLYGRFSREQLLPYLRDLGWAGSWRAIDEALDRFYPAELLGPEVFVDLNLGNLRDPDRCSLGLAVAQQHLIGGGDVDPRRTRVLASWIDGKLCAPEKAASVGAWASAGVELERLGPWRRRSMRFLDVKLVWQAGLGLTAKAYLGARRWQGLF
jgi:hypothetical protein